MKLMSMTFVLAFAALLPWGSAAAEDAFNQNASRSNHTNLSTGGEAETDAAAGVQDHNSSRSNKSATAPRDAASGQATGKRQHKPMATPAPDADNDGASDADAQGMAINEKGMPGKAASAKAGKTGSAK